jgi:ATP/maltotriose-dependent transcriptional regulator MalT
VESAKDPALCAAVRAHQAFVPGFAGNPANAYALLDAAHAQVRFAPSPRLTSWVYCVAAEIAARTGNAQDGMRQIQQAEQALTGRGEDPPWLDFFDESRWAGFAGQVYLLAGQAPQAVTHLRRALDQLEQNGQKQRSILLLDLACAQGHDDAADAAATAHEAFDALAVAPYDAAAARFPQLLEIVRATPYAREVEERIRTLPLTHSW